MKIEFDIKLKPEDLYRFNMYQTYTGMNGVISILLSIIVFVTGVVSAANGKWNYFALYLFISVVILCYTPITLKKRAQHVLKSNEVLANTLHYELSETVIRVLQGEESGELPWDQVYKMVATKNQILIYSNRINAYIIPRDQLGQQYAQVKELAQKVLPSYRVKLK